MAPKRNNEDDHSLAEGRNTRPRLEESDDLVASPATNSVIEGSCCICGRLSLGFRCQSRRSECQNIVCMAQGIHDGCIQQSEYEGIKQERGFFSCNSCCRGDRQPIPIPLASCPEAREIPRFSTDPLLIIAVYPGADCPDPQIGMIDEACCGQLRDYMFVKILTGLTRQGQKTARSTMDDDVRPFLDKHPSARILVIANFLSHSQTGEVEYVSSRGTVEGRRSKLLTVLSDWLTESFIEDLRTRNVLKGLMLLCGGSIVAVKDARADIVENLLENRVFTFALAFTSQQLIPPHVALPCLKFFRSCFLWEPNSLQGPRRLAQHQQKLLTPAFTAMCLGFAGNRNSNAHTGTVLLQRCTDETIASTEFRMGLPSILPFGLGPPNCPFDSCRESFNVRLSVNSNSTVNFRCQCGAVAKNVPRPQLVTELDFEEIGLFHFIIPFPTPEAISIRWERRDERGGSRLEKPWKTYMT